MASVVRAPARMHSSLIRLSSSLRTDPFAQARAPAGPGTSGASCRAGGPSFVKRIQSHPSSPPAHPRLSILSHGMFQFPDSSPLLQGLNYSSPRILHPHPLVRPSTCARLAEISWRAQIRRPGGRSASSATARPGRVAAQAKSKNADVAEVSEDEAEEEDDDEEEEEGEVELTEEDEAELKALLEKEGVDVGGGVSWKLADDDEFDEEDEEEDTELGDGLDGGGVVHGGAKWGPQVLAMAEGLLRDSEFSSSDLSIFGFRVYPERQIVRIRLDKLTDKWGSPAIEELQAFLQRLHTEVLAAEERNDLPKDIEIEVSTPGAERAVHVPQDLERFSHSPMYVCYNEVLEGGEVKIRHEVYELVEVDLGAEEVVWKLADIRVNREAMGKGRRLNKKQRETRIRVPYKDINIVRLYLDI